MASTVALFGTLDTKAEEYAFVRERLEAQGCTTVLVDAGVLGDPGPGPDVTREEVARAGGGDHAALVRGGDRAVAMATMSAGAAAVARRLREAGRLDGVMGLGGSNCASLLAAVAGALPVGVPKLVVSTIAAGDTRPYVAATDVTLMYPVVDISGLNRVSGQILANAAGAMAGMVKAVPYDPGERRPTVAATMFGVTTACVTALRHRLESLGYEVLVFHATGVGGASMETLIRSGYVDAVADVTTTELADELVGGVCSAGPGRLTAAVERGLPQVVSVGALDMVNFGPPETVPERFAGRRLHPHNPNVTLMRTSVDECAELGRRVAARLDAARAPTTVITPTGGLSAASAAGAVFEDRRADAALVEELAAHLRADIGHERVDADLDGARFGEAVAAKLHAQFRAHQDRTHH